MFFFASVPPSRQFGLSRNRVCCTIPRRETTDFRVANEFSKKAEIGAGSGVEEREIDRLAGKCAEVEWIWDLAKDQ